MACDGSSDSQDVEMSSATEEEHQGRQGNYFSQGNTSSCWYEHPRYNKYWAHHGKVCNWFKQHRRVKRELQHQQYVQRWQQWYQQQLMASSFSTDPSYYVQCMNWYYQMYQWYTQQATGYGQSYSQHHTGNQHNFKVPSSPAPKNKTGQFSETDRRRKRTESNCSRKSGSRPNSRNSNNSRGSRRKRTRKDKDRRKTEQIIVQMDDEEYIFESQGADSDDDESEEFEMEITEDMLQFFAASAKHRHLRDTKKETDEKTGEEKRVPREDIYVDLGQVGAGKNNASVLPPSERPGVKRTSEMKLLYGAGAAMIHGMETAMQLTFDRNCDINQPKLWPHLPLSIKFD